MIASLPFQIPKDKGKDKGTVLLSRGHRDGSFVTKTRAWTQRQGDGSFVIRWYHCRFKFLPLKAVERQGDGSFVIRKDKGTVLLSYDGIIAISNFCRLRR